jgi:RND family efflux transporter MFP subunit
VADQINRVALWAACLALAPLTACGNGKAEKAAPTDETFPVQTMTVQPGNMLRTLTAVGTVRYRRETPLGFTTSGKVASVRYDRGDFVKRGALLAALDSTNVGADLSVAEAERARAKAEFDRIAELYKEGWVTKGRYEAADTAAKAAAARVSQARFATGTSQLYAPSSGVILARNVEPGQVVAAGMAAVIMGQADQGFVFRVPVVDRDASKLRVGMVAEITLDALEGGPITATISEIEGQANAATGSFTVQFGLPARANIRAGQIGTASIKLPAANDGSLQIPASALFGVRTGEGLVYVVDPKTNRVETRNVVIDRLMDEFVIISGGLLQGDQIVVSGGEKLRKGAKVNPTAIAR